MIGAILKPCGSGGSGEDLVSACPTEPGKWRLTRFYADGEPCGHTVYGSMKDAILREVGWNVEFVRWEAPGGLKKADFLAMKEVVDCLYEEAESRSHLRLSLSELFGSVRDHWMQSAENADASLDALLDNAEWRQQALGESEDEDPVGYPGDVYDALCGIGHDMHHSYVEGNFPDIALRVRGALRDRGQPAPEADMECVDLAGLAWSDRVQHICHVQGWDR